MFERVLPRPIDHAYKGHQLAVWVFSGVLFMKIAQGAAVLFGGASVVGSADGIPLDTYSMAASQTIVSLWALLGFTRLLIYLLCLLVLVRYRSALPLMFGILLLQDLGRLLVFHFLPVARVGTPMGPTVNSILMALTLVGAVLSLWPPSKAPTQPA